jgi:hypothetical protein
MAYLKALLCIFDGLDGCPAATLRASTGRPASPPGAGTSPANTTHLDGMYQYLGDFN